MTDLSKDQVTAIAAKLPIRTQAFIDGAYHDAASGDTFATTNPATGEHIADIAHCGVDDVDKAVRAARRAFDSGVWSRAAPEHRKEVLLKLADLVQAHAHELAVMESTDCGKTITDALDEIGGEAVNYIKWYAELADKTFGKVATTGEDALGLIIKEPAGVAAAILPWNFPFLMAVWKVATALAAGCSLILKPAEQSPLTTIYLAELATEAGIPAGVISTLPGLGETTGQALGRHDDIDVISFTGSAEVGGYFMRYSGESNLKSVGLELGGKSPFIVLDDADIDDDLIEHAAMAAFWNGGQNCSANMRQIVDATRAEEYVERVVARANAYRIGDPLDPETEIGAMITSDHQNMVMGYIEKGQAEGARLVAGGSTLDAPGYFIQPTVFDGLTRDMTISREEIFGPVLGVLPVKGLDEALSVANDTEYGLHATVFTRDIDRAIHMARRLPCGTVAINGFTEGDIKTPFGGYKRSGSMARENGVEALDQYVQTKTIWITVGAVDGAAEA
jgi:acyl-CoA reductase-like NAD-dependent aldehyde dehydrogenase